MWTPDAIAKLQHSTRANNCNTYKEYAQIINDQSKRHMTLARPVRVQDRSMPRRSRWTRSSPPARSCKRFATGAMSLGSISTEAHATLADRHEPHRRQEQHRRRRRRPGALPPKELKGIPIKTGLTRWPERDLAADAVEVDLPLQDGDSLRCTHQAGGLGPLWRDGRIPVQRRPDPDQDGPGRQARRGRSVARRQGVGVHRPSCATRCLAWA